MKVHAMLVIPAKINNTTDNLLRQRDFMFNRFYVVMSSDTYLLVRDAAEAQRYVIYKANLKVDKINLEDLRRINQGWRDNIVPGK